MQLAITVMRIYIGVASGKIYDIINVALPGGCVMQKHTGLGHMRDKTGIGFGWLVGWLMLLARFCWVGIEWDCWLVGWV